MADAIGSVENAKKRLISMIETAISGAPYWGHVTGNWYDLPRHMTHLPLATVRVGPIVPEDEVYGMILSSSNENLDEGKLELWSFTVHCFASGCREVDEEAHRYVHQFADEIKDYLEAHRFEESNYGIQDIQDLMQRESTIEGVPRNVKRVIIEGNMLIGKKQTDYYQDRLPFRLA